jgi:hypothetical protein
MIWNLKISAGDDSERAKKILEKREQLLKKINANRQETSSSALPKASLVRQKPVAPRAQSWFSLENRVISVPVVVGFSGFVVGTWFGFSMAGVVSLAVFPALLAGLGYYLSSASDPKQY